MSLRAARRIAVLTALVAGVAYGWGIASNPAHYVNAAVVRSMSESWYNFLYGAFDPAGFLAIDSAPGGFWIQALFVRVLGYHSWVLLLPQVLAGAATVLVLFALVRRWAGTVPAVIAGIVLAATPITIAATRVNLIDPFLVLALLTAVYTFYRALEHGEWKWLVWTSVLVGLAFHVKLVPALGILPVLGAVYLACAPVPLSRRLSQVAVSGALTLAVSSIWVLVMALTPASARPYVDGSTSNSVWEMVFSYNTFDRAADVAPTGGMDLPVLPDGQVIPVDQGGDPSLTRMFGDLLGGQISWLLPLAGVLLVAGLLAGRHAPRTDRLRAGWLLWAGWLVVYGLAFSLAQSMHPYYTMLLAPPIAAIVGAGLYFAATRWIGRGLSWVLPVGLLSTGAWAMVVLGRSPDYVPWLRPVVVIATIVALVALMIYRGGMRRPGLGVVAVVVTGVAVLAGPVAWAVPAFSPPADARMAFFQTFNPVAGPDANAQSTGVKPTGAAGAPPGGPQQGGPTDGPPRIPPAMILSMMPTVADPKLMGFLRENNHGEPYDLATPAGSGAAPYISAGMSVIPMGGFGGTVPALTKDGLAEYTRTGQVRYVLFGGFSYESPTAVERREWVLQNCLRVDPSRYAGSQQMAFASVLFDCKP